MIQRHGRVLICQRRPGQRYALKWEFPGGKVEPGETPVQALCRELEEELAIRAIVGREVSRYQYTYPDRNPILLMFYEVTEFAGEPENLIFADMCWVAPARLPDYDFLEGDVDFVRRLACGR